jgi:hypothetical protein
MDTLACRVVCSLLKPSCCHRLGMLTAKMTTIFEAECSPSIHIMRVGHASTRVCSWFLADWLGVAKRKSSYCVFFPAEEAVTCNTIVLCAAPFQTATTQLHPLWPIFICSLHTIPLRSSSCVARQGARWQRFVLVYAATFDGVWTVKAVVVTCENHSTLAATGGIMLHTIDGMSGPTCVEHPT